MVLCPSRAKRDAEIQEIFESHADLFEANVLREYFILVVFLMRERAKGTDSFWHPYFEVVQLIDQAATWPDEQIEKLVDPELIHDIKAYKADLQDNWEAIKGILKLYAEDAFNMKNDEGVPIYEDQGLFYWAFNLVATHAIGNAEMPETMIVPLVDLFNHDGLSTVTSSLFHSKLHLAGNKIYMHDHNYDFMITEKKIAQADEKDEKVILDDKYGSRFREDKAERLRFNVKSIYDALGRELTEEELKIALGQSFPQQDGKQRGKYDEKHVLEDFVILEKFERSEQAEKVRDHARAKAANWFEQEQLYDDMKRALLKEAGYEDGIHLWTLGFKDVWNILGTPIMNTDEHDDD